MPAYMIIYLIILIPCTFIAFYYAFFMIVSLLCHRQKYEMVEDSQKFCIFVPCHNEESVIGATVENLSKINYNEDLFDVYFIADNCQDKTAEAIRNTINKLGKTQSFHVLERNVTDPLKRGKPHALRWGMDLLESQDGFYNKYDMFIIFDADNFVDADILKHMNSQYLSYKENKRPVMIQAYLDSKNKDNLIARGYYVSYRYTNGFFQLPRHKLGLAVGIGGTGFAMSTKFLEEIGGYNCKSLVEDLEIQTIATLKGRRIVYNHNTRIYDEKPTGFKAATVQKTRWCQGHWWVCFKYSWRLIGKMLNPKEIKYFFKRFDCLINLFNLNTMLLAMICSVYTIILQILKLPFGIPILGNITSALFIVSLLMFPVSSLLDGKKEEKKRVLIDFIPNMISLAINAISYYYANIIGLFNCKNQTVWKKTVHKVTTMESANEEKQQDCVVVDTDEEDMKENIQEN